MAKRTLDDLVRSLRRVEERTHDIVRDAARGEAGGVVRELRNASPHRTGNLRAAWKADNTQSGVAFVNTAPYARFQRKAGSEWFLSVWRGVRRAADSAAKRVVLEILN